jgi:hypothetical protein
MEYITGINISMKAESEITLILNNEERLEKIKTLCYN